MNIDRDFVYPVCILYGFEYIPSLLDKRDVLLYNNEQIMNKYAVLGKSNGVMTIDE